MLIIFMLILIGLLMLSFSCLVSHILIDISEFAFLLLSSFVIFCRFIVLTCFDIFKLSFVSFISLHVTERFGFGVTYLDMLFNLLEMYFVESMYDLTIHLAVYAFVEVLLVVCPL